MKVPTGRADSILVTVLVVLAAITMAIPTAVALDRPAPTSSPANGTVMPTPGHVVVAGGFTPGPGTEALGALPTSTAVSVLVGLPSQDPSGFASYEAAEYLPGTGAFHQFLSPSTIAARYGTTASTVATAESYFAGFGLRTDLSPDGLLLTVSGTSGAVARAFGTTFDQYRGLGGRTFFSHPTSAQLPNSFPISGAYGLGNVTTLQPLDLRPTSEVPVRVGPAATCGTGPTGLSPCQVWGAYDSAGLIANGTNGTGERIGVVDTYDAAESQDELESDLGTFDSVFDLPSPSVSYNYPVPTTQDLNTTYTGWGVEEALDLEWSHASAPGASIAFTFAPNSGVGLYLAVDWLVSHHLVDVISLSWGEPDVGIFNAYSGPCASECNASSDGSYEILSPVLQAAAVEGIGVFVATGDCGSADGTSGVSTDYPSSDPSVDAVGGTYLDVSSTGAYEGESGWSGNSSGASSPGCQNQGGSGGGFSPFPRPYWQSGTGLPSLPSARGTPDIAADASNGVTVVQGGGEGGVGGTSLATPIWAGFAAIADQYAGHGLGLLTPSLYSILRGSNYSTDFHDVLSGDNGYLAGTGWDPVTGIGTPILGQLVRDLGAATIAPSSLHVLLYSNQTYGPTPLAVQFGIDASGGTAPYPLEGVYFGDGTSALAVDGTVSHTFSQPGVYTVVAFAADASGNLTSSSPLAIVVGGGGGLNVTLTPSTNSPSVGQSVTFTTAVHGGLAPYGYVYSFGDGTFLNLSSAGTVVHAFGESGGFCAVVVVQDSDNPIDGARSNLDPIAVGGAAAPVCSNATEPLTVNAYATPPVRDAPADFPSLFRVSGGVAGPGFTETLTSTDPYVAACDCTIFRSPGTYSISLSVTDIIGDHASAETNVTVAPALEAVFTTSSTSGIAPLTVHFGVSVSGGDLPDANGTGWSFGDGTGAVGAAVEHTYTSPGFYSATGDATDRGQGNASEGFLIDVVAPDASTAPVLTATFAPAVNISSGTTIDFSARTAFLNGTPARSQIGWDLGENGSAWGPTAAETYYGGSFEDIEYLYATVSAVWPNGDPTTEANLVSPQLFASESDSFVPSANALVLTASSSPGYGLPGMVWSGTANVQAPGATSENWSFGDGSRASGPTVNHTFPRVGNFTVNVTASDVWGDVALVKFWIQVAPYDGPPLGVNGGPSIESGVAPLAVSFYVLAFGGFLPYTYAWTTGDGVSNSSASFDHTYDAEGTFTASITVRDAAGNSAQLHWTILVAAPGTPTTPLATSVVLYAAGGIVLAAAVIVVAWVVSTIRQRKTPPTP